MVYPLSRTRFFPVGRAGIEHSCKSAFPSRLPLPGAPDSCCCPLGPKSEGDATTTCLSMRANPRPNAAQDLRHPASTPDLCQAPLLGRGYGAKGWELGEQVGRLDLVEILRLPQALKPPGTEAP
jgi:hypothetical protein